MNLNNNKIPDKLIQSEISRTKQEMIELQRAYYQCKLMCHTKYYKVKELLKQRLKNLLILKDK